MNTRSLAVAFERLLVALEAEILAASDEEIAEVLAEGGMTLGMKGSVSLVELTDPRGIADCEREEVSMDEGPVNFVLPLVPRRQ